MKFFILFLPFYATLLLLLLQLSANATTKRHTSATPSLVSWNALEALESALTTGGGRFCSTMFCRVV